MKRIDRRMFVSGLGAAAIAAAAGPARASRESFVMWHSPGCGCCLEWVRRVDAAFGRRMEVREVADIAAVKRAQGVPDDLWSCHTARIGRILVEGHVPVSDIRRLLQADRSPILGLAVPGMPLGSPGMDMGHDRREAYQVIAFSSGGRRSVFARHG